MPFDVDVDKSADDCVFPVENEAMDRAVRNSLLESLRQPPVACTARVDASRQVTGFGSR